MSNDAWDPDTYERFAALRARPFWDLAELVDTSQPVTSIVDLGCGTGELTAAVAAQWNAADALGIDSSSAMLAKSSAFEGPGVRFQQGDIGSWHADTPVDVIIANASLHWVSNHAAVLGQWVDSLAPGGQLAVQVPANADHPSHTCSVAVAEREPFRSAVGDAPPPDPVADNVLAPEDYAALLFGLGITDPHVRLQVYPQVMDSSDHVVEWTKGTSLTRFFTALPDELHEPFLDAYRTELLATIGDHAPYLYTFKRILMWGRRSD